MNVSACKLKVLSSLVKVFPDEEPKAQPECTVFTALKGETISFQVAVRSPLEGGGYATISVDSPLSGSIRLREVRLVPSAFPCYPAATDDNYLRTAPGLFPDLLSDLAENRCVRVTPWWKAIWIDVEVTSELAAGQYPITVSITDASGEDDGALSACATLTVLDAALPKQTLLHTEWFHADCLADFYRVDAFSEEHWHILKNFIQTAAKRGINMLLTPTFTQPLDTDVGGERTTVQLVDVTVENGAYRFGFDKLKRWVDLCLECGIEYFEIAHLFTQWGAKAAPKVMATVDGEYKRIFGWDTPATGEAYTRFLSCYLPELTAKLTEWGIAPKCYFHISDEPSGDQLEGYLAAKRIVAPYLKGFHLIDALSDYSFYESGAVEHPVPANNHIEPFLEHNVPNLWTYYCCGQAVNVSNRFMSMPSLRNRIIGVQMYKYQIAGFLHWGFNFYNTMLSRAHINPYVVTDAGGGFPSGDAFLVYPKEDGTAEESIRLMVFSEALADLRALQLLESLTSREYVVALIDENLSEPITFSRYPKEDSYLLNLRNRVNREIAQRLAAR